MIKIFKSVLWVLAAFAFLPAMADPGASRVNGSAILATVNGEAVTLGDVLRESSGNETLAYAYASDDPDKEIAKLRQEAVDRIIDRKLLIGEFHRLNLAVPEQYVENMLDDLAVNLHCRTRSELAAKARSMNVTMEELRTRAKERLMAEIVIGRYFYAAPAPTPQEIREYFDKHQDEFATPETVELALLMLPLDTDSAELQKITDRLNKDAAAFAELVKAFPNGPNADRGGSVGTLERKNLRKEFAAVLPEHLENTKVYGPVKTAEGVYYLKIEKVIPGKAADFAAASGQIRKQMELAAREKALKSLLENLRQKAVIRYYFGSNAIAAEKESERTITTITMPEKKPVKKTEKKTMVTLKTNYGDIKLELFDDAAPKTVANFLEYVKSGFYNGTLFHRVIDGFMIQGGGFDLKFKQKATREPIENEADNRLSNEIGTIAMARTMDPHSATCQFFINVNNNDFLDFRSPSPQFYGYCVFGKVVEGMDVVNRIKEVKTTSRGGHQDVPVEDVVIQEAVID
ncbi:MAG: hypothetical protein E7047_05065 [Lentisphaerae bacterium]|nr:hypothetical protein [Lentisphaerota bacterium]